MEPEPLALAASESFDDPHDVVSRSSAFPSSNAVAALAAARTLSAGLRNGRTTRPTVFKCVVVVQDGLPPRGGVLPARAGECCNPSSTRHNQHDHLPVVVIAGCGLVVAVSGKNGSPLLI